MERVIKILSAVDRPGMDRVIEYLRQSDFATARCRTHHNYPGGLADHSIEVYERMKIRSRGLAEDSVAICALLHDVGKSHLPNFARSKHHTKRSIEILNRCNLCLTDNERAAIYNHHKVSLDYLTNSLRYALSSSDMNSTGRWKIAHTRSEDRVFKRLKDRLLYLFSLL